MRNSGNHRTHKLSIEELQLIADAFRSGDKQAFHAVYYTFESQVFRFCKHMLGSHENAADAFQETFIRVYEHRTSLNTNNIRAWVFTISRRVCLNHIRALRGNHESFDEVMHAPQRVQESDVYLQISIEKAISELPISLREALILRDIEGYSYNEISDITGIDLSLAKVRVFRARMILRKRLAPLVQADK